jgi:hypothetical protein
MVLSCESLHDRTVAPVSDDGGPQASVKGDAMRITTSVLQGVPQLLKSWPGISGSYETTGTIQHTAMLLTPTEGAALGRDTNERKREEVNRLALEWATLAHLESNFLKPEYQQNFAVKHTSKVLGTLNREWLEAYRRVLGDPELYAIIQDQHPHVLDFLEARLEVIRIAERLAVELVPPPPAPEPKPKVTANAWRACMERYRQWSLTHKRVKVKDCKADVMQNLHVYPPEQVRRRHTRPQRATDVVRARSFRRPRRWALMAALVVVSLLGAGALWQSPLVSHQRKEYTTRSGLSSAVVPPSPAVREPPLLPQTPAYREPPLLPQTPAYREPPPSRR